MIVTIGVIARAHGVKGEVVVDLRTDTPEDRFVPRSVVTTEPGRRTGDAPAIPSRLTIEHARPHSGRFLVRFAELKDRDAAERLRGVRLVAEVPDNAEAGEPDEFYTFQLAGLAVELPDGQQIGEVVEVAPGAAQDLLTVRVNDARTVLVPFVSEIVTNVDVDAGRVVIDPPPGLLELGTDGEPS